MVRVPAQRSLAAALRAAVCLAGLVAVPPRAPAAGPAGYANPVSRAFADTFADPAGGEHEFRAATSRDGRHWTWGGTWTLPAGTRPRIGLISHGGAGAVAEFDYIRIYQP